MKQASECYLPYFYLHRIIQAFPILCAALQLSLIITNASNKPKPRVTILESLHPRSTLFITVCMKHEANLECANQIGALPGCCLLRRTPFSNVVRMRTRGLVPKPKTV